MGGGHEPSTRFLKACKNHLMENEPLELTEGTQKRDIVRVEDVVGIISLLVMEKCIIGYRDLPVGTGESYPIKDVIAFMKEHSESKSKLNFGAVRSREGEPNTCADINWFSEIGYELKYSYWDGLLGYVEEK